MVNYRASAVFIIHDSRPMNINFHLAVSDLSKFSAKSDWKLEQKCYAIHKCHNLILHVILVYSIVCIGPPLFIQQKQHIQQLVIQLIQYCCMKLNLIVQFFCTKKFFLSKKNPAPPWLAFFPLRQFTSSIHQKMPSELIC